MGTGAILRRDGEMVGFSGLSALRMRIGAEEARVAQCVDYMVDPGARGGMAGLYGLRLLQHWEKLAHRLGYQYGIGFPNINSARLVTSPKLDWRPGFSTTLLVRPFARISLPAAPVGGLSPPVAAAGLAVLAGWSALAGGLRRRSDAGRPVDVRAFEPGFRMSPPEDGLSGTIADAAHLNWRFVRHPLNRYGIVGWTSGGVLRGYAVTAPRVVFGIKATLLVDLAGGADGSGAERGLIAEVVRRARAGGAAMVATLSVAGSARHRTLVGCGFIPVPARYDPKPFVMTTHGLGDQAAAERLAAARWRFNWADMDVV